MTPNEAAAAVAKPIADTGAKFMFDGAVYGAAAEHGFGGLDFYITGRCGVLGDVSIPVLVGALGYFEAASIEALWTQGVAAQPPATAAQLWADACAAWGRDHFGADLDYGELASLAQRIVDAAPITGLPIFAGWKAMPVPTDDKGAAMHLINVLREFRANAHLLAILANGVTPLEALVHTGGIPNAQLFGYAEPFPEVESIRGAMEQAEAATNSMVAVAFAALDDTELDRFVELATAARRGLT